MRKGESFGAKFCGGGRDDRRDEWGEKREDRRGYDRDEKGSRSDLRDRLDGGRERIDTLTRERRDAGRGDKNDDWRRVERGTSFLTKMPIYSD